MGDPVVGGVTVEIKGNDAQLSAALAVAKSKAEAFDRAATGALKNVADAASRMGTDAAVAVDKTAKAQERLLSEFQKTGAISAEAVRAVGGYAQAQQILNDKLAQGTKLQNENAQATRAAAAAHASGLNAYSSGSAAGAIFQGGSASSEQVRKESLALAAGQAQAAASMYQGAHAAGEAAANVEKLAEKAALGKGQLANLSYQLNDVISGLLQGQRPMQILTQQGGQIVQVLGQGPGGVGGSLRALAGFINPAVIGMVALGAATAIAAKLAYDHVKALDKESQEVRGLGRFAGLTAKELDELAVSSAKAGSIGVSAGRELTEAYLRVGTIGPQMNARLVASTRDYAAAMGLDLKTAAKSLADAFGDPEKGAGRLNAALGILSASEQHQIEMLAAAGRYEEAQARLLDKLNAATKGAADQQNYLSRKLHEIGVGFDQAKDKAGAYLSVIAELAAKSIGAGLRMDAGRLAGPAPPPEAPAKSEAELKLEAERAAAIANMNRDSARGSETAREINPDFAQRQALQAQRLRLQTGQTAAGAMRDDQAFREQTDALDRVTQAERTYLDQGQRATAMQRAQLDAIRAITPAQKAAAAAEQERINLAGQYVTAAEREQRIAAASATAYAQATQGLILQNQVLAANTNATLVLAEETLKGAAAAERAAATRKAVTDSITNGADAVQQAHLNLAAAVASEAASGAQAALAAQQQADAQRKANDAVAAGLILSDEGQRLAALNVQLLGLEAAAANADAEAKDTLNKVTVALGAATADLNLQLARAAILRSTEADKDATTQMKLELALLYETNRERAVAIAKLQAEQELKRQKIDPNSQEGRARIDAATDRARAGDDTESGQFVKGLRDQVEAQARAYERAAHSIGMTREAAARYNFVQGALDDAAARGITVTDKQRQQIEHLGDAYARAAEQAKRLEERQRAAADAAGFLADSLGDALISAIDGSSSAEDALKGLVRSLTDATLQATLLGKGPLAGMFGTDKTAVEGGPNGGLLNQLFGKAFGMPGTGGKPTGAAGDPLWVKSADAAGMGGGQGGGVGGIFGAIGKAFGLGGGGPGSAFAPGYFGQDGGVFGTLGGADMMAGLFHDGIPSVGTGGSRRMAPAALFASAPRLHSGLRPGEFPAILEHGERVTSKRDVARERGGRGGLTVNFLTPDIGSFNRNGRQVERSLKRRLGKL